MSSPVQKFKFPTAEEITRDWGERCPDVDQDCGCCQMWNTFDLIAANDAELIRLREIVERAQAIISTATYPNWHETARAALNHGDSDA